MSDSLTVADAVRQYLATLAAEERATQQADLIRFTQWINDSRFRVTDLTPLQIENYQAALEATGADTNKRLAAVKGFLGWVDDKGYAPQRLAKYVKLKRVPAARRAGATATAGATRQREVIHLTREGYERLKAELEHHLTVTRKEVAQALLEARADRDIRENAPYDAAKNHQAQVEARIRELQAIMAAAEIIDEASAATADRVTIGTTVIVRDMTHDDEMRYTLVSSNEANPRLGRISTSSPVGRALLDKQEGDEVEVTVPAGTMRYRIERIERSTA